MELTENIIINSHKYGTFEVLLDKGDFEKVNQFKWRIIKSEIAKADVFYAIRECRKNGKRNIEKLQHFLFGKPKKGFDLTFKNNNTLDIRKENISHTPHINKYYNNIMYSDNDTLNVLKELISFNSNKEIAELYGVKESYISSFLSKNKIKRDRNNEFSDEKKCTKCKTTKNISKFRKTKRGYRSSCVKCEKEFNNKYRKDNRNAMADMAAKRYRENILQSLMNGAKARAKKRELDFDLDIEFLKLKWTGVCELSGIKFDKHVTSKPSPNRPSIDRIDNSKGYTKNNVRIILWGLNRAINDSGLDVYLNIAMCVIKKQNNNKRALELFKDFANLNIVD